MQHHSSVRTGLALVLLPAAAALLSVPAAARAQATTGIIEGRITDAASGRVLPNAQVFVAGTTVGAQTSDAGTFRITGVPARQVEVRVRLIGFAPANKTVVVTAGATVRADFALSTSALQLDQVVVTGTGQRTEVKRLGNTVSVVKPPEIAPINTTSDLLQGREPGVVGMPSSGMTGEGARIRIRGNSSLSQSNEPIVFIDGIRVNAGGGFGEGVGAGGGGATSRLDDLDPSSIERMEILKGAAAATLYGTEASNGVIQIFTKRGSVGVPRWSLNLQQDAIQFPDRVPANAGYPRTAAQAQQASAFWGRTLQPFEVFEVPVFRDNVTEIGRATTAALSVQGGTPVITYFASGRYRGENGPVGYGGALGQRLSNLPGSLRPVEDEDTQMQGTVNLSIVPTSKLRVGLRTSYINRATTIPENNNNIYGLNSLAFMARPEQANCNRSAVASPGRCTGEGNIFGNQAFMTVPEAALQRNQTEVGRFNGAAEAEYTINSALRASVTFGADVTSQQDYSFSPFGYNIDLFTGQTPDGARVISNRDVRVLTLDSKLSWNQNFGRRLASSFTAGVQVFNDRTTDAWSSAQTFPGPGIEVVSAGGQARDFFERYLTTVNGGYFAQEQLSLDDWIHATVGGRYDYSSAFGAEAPGVFYPKISLSVVPSDLKGWSSSMVSQLRLRAAVGQSGRQPGAFDRFTTFAPLTSELGAGLVPSQLGNQTLEPEISTEIEGGFELGLFANRVGVDVTYWNRRVRDVLVDRQFPTSNGFRNRQLANIGAMRGNGLELGLRGMALNRENASLELFANGAYLSQTVTSLGGAPPLKVGYFRYRGFIKEGDPLGSLYSPILASACPSGGPRTNKAGQPVACYGANQFPISLNGNGRAATREELLAYLSQPRDLRTGAVQSALRPLLADEQGNGNVLEQRVGDVIPDWAGAFGATLTFRKSWRLYSLFEYKQGFLVQNLTDGFRNSQHASIGSNRREYATIEAALLNPASTPEQRLAAADSYVREYRRLLEPGLHQHEPGDFIRWRELSLSYTANPSLARFVRARSLAVTLTGRNLLLWTKYSGVDPEINAIGRNGSTDALERNFLDSTDAFGVPIPRRFAISANLGF